MSTPFTDIRISGLEVAATELSPTAAGLRLMKLKLSDLPPEEWKQIFDGERRFPRHSKWRRAWIQGSCIVVDCVPEELEQDHLRDLKEDVANANTKFRELLTREKRRDHAIVETARRERERIEAVNKRLKFD